MSCLVNEKTDQPGSDPAQEQQLPLHYTTSYGSCPSHYGGYDPACTACQPTAVDLYPGSPVNGVLPGYSRSGSVGWEDWTKANEEQADQASFTPAAAIGKAVHASTTPAVRAADSQALCMHSLNEVVSTPVANGHARVDMDVMSQHAVLALSPVQVSGNDDVLSTSAHTVPAPGYSSNSTSSHGMAAPGNQQPLSAGVMNGFAGRWQSMTDATTQPSPLGDPHRSTHIMDLAPQTRYDTA